MKLETPRGCPACSCAAEAAPSSSRWAGSRGPSAAPTAATTSTCAPATVASLVRARSAWAAPTPSAPCRASSPCCPRWSCS